MCGNISVERSPSFSRLMPRFDTQYGREQMSMTARERACRDAASQYKRLIDAAHGEAYLVKRCEARAVSPDTPHLPQCLLECRTESYRAVLWSDGSR